MEYQLLINYYKLFQAERFDSLKEKYYSSNELKIERNTASYFASNSNRNILFST